MGVWWVNGDGCLVVNGCLVMNGCLVGEWVFGG